MDKTLLLGQISAYKTGNKTCYKTKVRSFSWCLKAKLQNYDRTQFKILPIKDWNINRIYF